MCSDYTYACVSICILSKVSKYIILLYIKFDLLTPLQPTMNALQVPDHVKFLVVSQHCYNNILISPPPKWPSCFNYKADKGEGTWYMYLLHCTVALLKFEFTSYKLRRGIACSLVY